MDERRFVIDTLALGYSGLINVDDFLDFINKWVRNHGYTQKEVRCIEKVHEKHKEIEYIFEPFKQIREKVQYLIKIEIFIRDLKEVSAYKDDVKQKVQKGFMDFVLSAFIVTDMEHEFETRYWVAFLRRLFDKFVYQIDELKYDAPLVKETEQLHKEVKGFLNLYRFYSERIK